MWWWSGSGLLRGTFGLWIGGVLYHVDGGCGEQVRIDEEEACAAADVLGLFGTMTAAGGGGAMKVGGAAIVVIATPENTTWCDAQKCRSPTFLR